MSLFQPPEPVEHEVNGEVMKFYPLRLPTLWIAKSLIKRIGSSFASFSSAPDAPSKRKDDAEGNSEISLLETSTDQTKLAEAMKQKAFDELSEALLDQASWNVIVTIILDSLRQELSKDDIAEFKNQLDIGTAMDCLFGVFAAHRGRLGKAQKEVQDSKEKLATATQTLSGMR